MGPLEWRNKAMNESKYESSGIETALAPELSAGPRALALSFDIDAYRKFVADAGLTEEQEAELLSALWEVVVSFVDLGFNISPVQQAMAKPLELDSSVVVSSGDNSEVKKFSSRAALASRVPEGFA